MIADGGSRMDLSFLHAVERERVLEVLQRDKVLRSVEENRIRSATLDSFRCFFSGHFWLMLD